METNDNAMEDTTQTQLQCMRCEKKHPEEVSATRLRAAMIAPGLRVHKCNNALAPQPAGTIKEDGRGREPEDDIAANTLRTALEQQRKALKKEFETEHANETAGYRRQIEHLQSENRRLELEMAKCGSGQTTALDIAAAEELRLAKEANAILMKTNQDMAADWSSATERAIKEHFEYYENHVLPAVDAMSTPFIDIV